MLTTTLTITTLFTTLNVVIIYRSAFLSNLLKKILVFLCPLKDVSPDYNMKNNVICNFLELTLTPILKAL